MGKTHHCNLGVRYKKETPVWTLWSGNHLTQRGILYITWEIYIAHLANMYLLTLLVDIMMYEI